MIVKQGHSGWWPFLLNIFMKMEKLLEISEKVCKNVNKSKKIYGTKKIMIPPPHFVVFYNGVNKRPEKELMKLSDLYEIPEEEKDLELRVIVININKGKMPGY